MTLKAIPLVQGVQLGTSAAAQYTCPASQSVVVRHATFANTTASAVTLTAYVVPSGGSVGDATTVISQQSIAGHASYVSPELSGVVLNTGDTIQCLASAGTSISLTASGVAQT